MSYRSSKNTSLHAPVPARKDAKASEVGGMLQSRRGYQCSGLQLASVPEVKSRAEERGRQELVTPEAFKKLCR